MPDQRDIPEQTPTLDRGIEQPQAISLEVAATIAGEVRDLIRAGEEQSAWERLRNLHPADMGSIVASLPRTSRDAMVRAMSPDTVAWMLRQMNPVEAGRVGARLGAGVLSFVIDQVNPQQALETLRSLPIPRAREVSKALERPLPDADIFQHTPRTAGALMVTEFPAVHLDDRAATALDSLRTLDGMARKFTHVLIINDDHELGSQVHMVDLALADDDAPVSSIAVSVVATVDADTTADECARLQRHYNLTQLPVVQEGRLIGVILAESLLGAVVEQGTSQMLKVASVAGEGSGRPPPHLGAHAPSMAHGQPRHHVSRSGDSRSLRVDFNAGCCVGCVPARGRGQGGIGGTQTLTLIVRSIALGELVGVRARRLVAREASLGVLHGVWLGALVAGIAMLWQQNLGLAMVLGLAMLGNMIIAGCVGAGVPLFLRRIRVDPAVASAVVVTTFTDVFGFLLFLGIATAAIGLLV